MAPTRTLPLRIPRVPGEGLDSWLDALAVRNAAPLSQMIEALGLSDGMSRHDFAKPLWTTALTSQESEHLAFATGVDQEQLRDMTLARWQGRAIQIDLQRRRVDRHRLWGRSCGSRYCPACLKETEGRWQLSWRLAWTFACTRHRMLLADSCPSCDAIPRTRANYLGTLPVLGTCPTESGDRLRNRCNQDLAQAAAPVLEEDSPLIRTQRMIADLIEVPAETTTAFAGVYGHPPIAVRQILADLKTFAVRVLAVARDEDLVHWGNNELVQRCNEFRRSPLTSYRGRREAHIKGPWAAPTDAAATGIALSAALHALSAPEPSVAMDRIAWLTDRLQASGSETAHCDIKRWSTEASSELAAIVLGATHREHGRRAVRLHYRSTIGRPRQPVKGLDLPRARAEKIPVSLWDTWTLRLMPRTCAGNLSWATVQQALAVSTLQVGAWINLPQAMRIFGTNIEMKTLSRTLETLHRDEAGVEILQAITLLADHLDTEGAPINYARRREVFGRRNSFLTADQWTEIQ